MVSERRRGTTRGRLLLDDLFVVTLMMILAHVQAFTFLSVPNHQPPRGVSLNPRTCGGKESLLPMSAPPHGDVVVGDDDDDDDDEPEAEPGTMRVSEIKAELELRGIDFGDCFDRESLADELRTARAAGIADPALLERFNKQKLEQAFHEAKVEIRDEDIDMATARDGTLPGGMTPDAFKKLTGNPDVMALLSSTKMQEAMKLMMTGGRDTLERRLREDPELQETVRKLDQVLREAQ